jgi:hypothetical protein
MREELHIQYDNPYPVETAIFRLEGSDVAAEVTRTLFHTARAYTESFRSSRRDELRVGQVEGESRSVPVCAKGLVEVSG